jgi:hypothetical protein
LIVEKLLSLRSKYTSLFQEYMQFVKEDSQSYKSITDEDVWLSHAEVLDDQTLVLHFLILTFEIRE